MDLSNKAIIGGVTVFILAILGFIMYRKTDNTITDNTPKIVIKEDNIINDYLEKEFSKVLKIFSGEVKKSAQSMVKFNDKFLLQNDYLNFRNSLYTKDIEKHSIMIDTKNICHCSETHSFIFYFNNNDNNNTGGLDIYKNVIGFRLIKATIQNLHYIINGGNNTLIFTYGGTQYTATLDKKLYDSEDDIAAELQTKMNDFISGNHITVSYDNETLKYTIEDNNSTNIELLFADTTAAGSSIYRLLGFNNDNTSASTTHTSDNVSDSSIHYVDIVISEIPYMACKKNPKGKSLIDRIPIDVGTGSLVHYKAPITDYFSQNYFYPISLSKLTIDLFQDSHNIPYYNENADHFFEFEITMLKNTKLSN